MNIGERRGLVGTTSGNMENLGNIVEAIGDDMRGGAVGDDVRESSAMGDGSGIFDFFSFCLLNSH